MGEIVASVMNDLPQKRVPERRIRIDYGRHHQRRTANCDIWTPSFAQSLDRPPGPGLIGLAVSIQFEKGAAAGVESEEQNQGEKRIAPGSRPGILAGLIFFQ